MDKDFLQDFLAEAEELIEALYDDLDALRYASRSGALSGQVVERIFRRVHTIKGGAATAELEHTARLTDAFESLLDEVRRDRDRISPRLLNLFDAVVLAVSDSLSLTHRGEETRLQELTDRCCRELVEAKQQIASQANSQPQATPTGADANPSIIYVENRQVVDAPRHTRLFVIELQFSATSFDDDFRRLSEYLAERGQVISTLPNINQDHPDRIHFRLTYQTAMNRQEVIAAISQTATTLVELDELTAQTNGSMNSNSAHISMDVYEERAAQEVESSAVEGSTTSSNAPPATVTSHLAARSVRVPLNKLLTVADAIRALEEQTLRELEAILNAALPDAARRSIERHQHLLRQGFGRLAEQAKELHMVPAAFVLQRAARAGAVAARASGKAVDIEINDAGMQLDKMLADNLHEPLLHLLRNAVDHGIETAVERAAQGKAGRGRVSLEAEREGEGGRIILRVRDDGRGIDMERVRQVAVAQNMITVGSKLTEQQALNLILQPGFSTAKGDSMLSGRGVGLDVVAQSAKRISGELRIHTRAGVGTTFELLLPAPTDLH